MQHTKGKNFNDDNILFVKLFYRVVNLIQYLLEGNMFYYPGDMKPTSRGYIRLA